MGAWSPAIFSDDTACDVREEYRGLLGDGVPAPQATDRLLEKWQEELSDPDVAPVFWLALAATQWKVGRLEERVKQEAVGVVESGSDLARWHSDPHLESRRRKVLEKLKAQLNLPQPAPRKIPKPFRDSTDWQFGEAVGYRVASGRWVLFRVIGFHRDLGGTTPICELLDWINSRLPQPHEVKKLGILRGKSGHDVSQFLLSGLKGKPAPDRVSRPHLFSRPAQRLSGYTVFFWRFLDESLLDVFQVG